VAKCEEAQLIFFSVKLYYCIARLLTVHWLNLFIFVICSLYYCCCIDP